MATMKDFAIQSLAIILTALILIVGLPLALKLLFAVGPIPFALIVVGVLTAMALK
jgi:hypothetical protein